MRRIQVAASAIGARLLRNNVILGWVGNIYKPLKRGTVNIGPGDIVIRNARPVKAGLGTGSSDLIGWVPIEITADMVGKTLAIFCAVEVKTEKGVVREEQQDFIFAVNKAGGVAFVARSPEEVVQQLSH